jgi:hypothetical protein
MKMMEEYILIRWQTDAFTWRPARLSLNLGGVNGREGQYHTDGGGNTPWTWTSTTQLGQTSDGPGPLPSLFSMGGVHLVGTR